MKLLCFFILLVALYEVNASSKRLCGRVLVQVLDSICINGYNPHPVKKSVPLHRELNHLDIDNDIEADIADNAKSTFLDDLLMEDNDNSVALTRRRRNLLGIYEECCVKACSFDNLSSYCL